MLFSYEEYTNVHFVYGVCNSNANAAIEEYQKIYPRQQIPDRRMFTCVH